MAAELDFDPRALSPVYVLHLVTSDTRDCSAQTIARAIAQMDYRIMLPKDSNLNWHVSRTLYFPVGGGYSVRLLAVNYLANSGLFGQLLSGYYRAIYVENKDFIQLNALLISRILLLLLAILSDLMIISA